MSKKQINTNKDTTMFNHVVEKKSGSRGTYFDTTDEMTAHGTGNGEMIIRALGFNNLDEKKHWKKGFRPFGIRRDIGTNESQLSRAKIYMSDEGVEMDMDSGLLMLNQEYYNKIKIPNLRKLMSLRKNPSLKKARKTAEVYANELAHFTKNPDELKQLMAKQNAGTLEFVSEKTKDQVIDAFAQQFIADRKSKLESMKKI